MEILIAIELNSPLLLGLLEAHAQIFFAVRTCWEVRRSPNLFHRIRNRDKFWL